MALIKTDHIFLRENFATQDEVMHFLADKAVLLGLARDEKKVYQKLLEREAEGTTGMMDGFAIPHAKDITITTADILIVSLDNPVDWHSLDGSPTDFIIALFIPDSEAGTTHLKLLSSVARLLMHQDVTKGLKAASTPTEIADLLNSKLAEN
ncbi:PTS fructose transporter subunit IIA [Enterococcus saigonensis]|uniref:PTS fructose transporter subunit IIA n=1 Tax=Enterococcus saigonensis TaxID=1805431 RepID=A0A679I642_9ENTE|nr:fructose PTS transporter subunit IIA [Enterococcus saigonensis]BCA85028.1 PTS fructose transporter subunit IIA [Enterococcus saigonensis]